MFFRNVFSSSANMFAPTPQYLPPPRDIPPSNMPLCFLNYPSGSCQLCFSSLFLVHFSSFLLPSSSFPSSSFPPSPLLHPLFPPPRLSRSCRPKSGPGGGREAITNSTCMFYYGIQHNVTAKTMNVIRIFLPDTGTITWLRYSCRMPANAINHFRVRCYQNPLTASTEAHAAHARLPTIACIRPTRIAPKPYARRLLHDSCCKSFLNDQPYLRQHNNGQIVD